jgi:hypothetical protein
MRSLKFIKRIADNHNKTSSYFFEKLVQEPYTLQVKSVGLLYQI